MSRHRKLDAYESVVQLEMNLKATRGISNCPVIHGPDDLARVFRKLGRLEREVLISGAVDCKCRLICWSLLGVGSSHVVSVRIGDAFQDAVRTGAMGIVLVHNHPTGSLEGSDADHNLTRLAKQSGLLLGYPLLDHVIIAKSGFRTLMPRRMNVLADETPMTNAAESGAVAGV